MNDAYDLPSLLLSQGASMRFNSSLCDEQHTTIKGTNTNSILIKGYNLV